jgi:type I restriction enzyme S subunit
MNRYQMASFSEAFEPVPVGCNKLQARLYQLAGRFPVVDQGQSEIAGYADDDSLVLSADGPVILFGDHTRAVKYIDFPFVVGADGVRLYRARDGFDSEYIYYFLKGAPIRNDGYGRHSKHLHELRLPRLPIDDQRRVAADLKAQLTAVEEARLAAQVQIDELTKLAHAIVRESIVHADTEIRLLGAVLDEVKRGIGADWADFPVLGATRAGLAAAKEPVGKNPERYKPVRVGTVFYNPMRILIGSIAMVDEADTPGVTSPDYVVLRGREGLVDSRGFYYWLRSPAGRTQCIASLARGAARERMLFNRLAEGDNRVAALPGATGRQPGAGRSCAR